MTARDQTVVCVLTPAGRGAVAVIGVEGANAASLADRFFRAANRKPLEHRPTQRIVYGQWLSCEDQAEGEDLVVCRRSDTQSGDPLPWRLAILGTDRRRFGERWLR